MYFLVIDTATNCGGVAVSRNSEVIGSVMLKTPMRYSDNLIPCVDFLLKELDMAGSELGGLIVATGPGSFTGLRIGIAAAKAFGQTWSIPAVGLSTLEALAFRFRHAGREVVPWLDARRQQIFGAVYRLTEFEAKAVHPEWVGPPADWFRTQAGPGLLYVGDGATLYRTTIEAFDREARVLTTDNHILHAMCLLGCRRFSEGLSVPVEELRANYVRPPDAEMMQPLRSVPSVDDAL